MGLEEGTFHGEIINFLPDATFVILLITQVRQIPIMQRQGSQQLARPVIQHRHGQALLSITHGSRQAMEMQTEYVLPVIPIHRTMQFSSVQFVIQKLKRIHTTQM